MLVPLGGRELKETPENLSAPDSQRPDLSRARPTLLQRVVGFVRGRLAGGLLIIAPFVITYLIFRWLYDTASGILGPVVVDVFGRDIPGLSVALLVLITFLVGLITIQFIGQRLLYLTEATLVRVPVIGPTFSVMKQLISSLGPMSGTGFSRVVEIEYPRKGLWAIGFLTATTVHHDGAVMGVVYLPTAPTPNSGWLAIVPMDDVYDLDMTANQALSLTISAGMATGPLIKRDSHLPASHFVSRDPGSPAPASD